MTNVEGLTPLMCCSQQGHAHVVRFIIDTHPRCVFFCNTAGDSALHYAGDDSPPSSRCRLYARACVLTRPQVSVKQVSQRAPP